MSTTFASDAVLIRPAGPADAEAIQRLAELDSARVPSGRLLVAEVDGRIVAALRISDHTVIADPFSRTAGLVSLLRARAEHLGGGRRARVAPRPLGRRAPALRPGF